MRVEELTNFLRESDAVTSNIVGTNSNDKRFYQSVVAPLTAGPYIYSCMHGWGAILIVYFLGASAAAPAAVHRINRKQVCKVCPTHCVHAEGVRTRVCAYYALQYIFACTVHTPCVIVSTLVSDASAAPVSPRTFFGP